MVWSLLKPTTFSEVMNSNKEALPAKDCYETKFFLSILTTNFKVIIFLFTKMCPDWTRIVQSVSQIWASLSFIWWSSFRLKAIFTTTSAASKNEAHFQSGKNRLKNNNFASLIWIRDTLCNYYNNPFCLTWTVCDVSLAHDTGTLRASTVVNIEMLAAFKRFFSSVALDIVVRKGCGNGSIRGTAWNSFGSERVSKLFAKNISLQI